jgi:putative ABC transport system permease protein
VKYLPLVWAGLWRKPIAAVLTGLSISVAFMLFGCLHGIAVGIDAIVDRISANRIRVQSNSQEPLPVSMYRELKEIPNIDSVTLVVFFGTYFQDMRNRVPSAAIGGDISLHTRSDIVIPKAQSLAFMKLRTGAVVGESLAREHGWKVGDRVPLTSWAMKRDGTNTWFFDIVGTYARNDGSDTAREFWVHYDYFNEGRLQDRDTVHSYLLRSTDAKHNTQVIQDVDNRFVNSGYPTVSQSDREWQNAGFKRTVDVHLIVNTIIVASLFALLFLTTNTMMQSFRSRTAEFAVLKSLGYSDHVVLAIVIAEAVVLYLLGAAIGLALARPILPSFAAAVGFAAIPTPLSVSVTGLGIALAAALLSAAIPAARAKRLSVVAALGRR